MQPSVSLCDTQEAIQRERAAGATLDNVRSQANSAAAAWAKEGALAKKREERKQITLAAIEAGAESTDGEERGLSENPDRGHPEDAIEAR